jgi:glycosyltransferase involved in cell wall biosynthesis
MITPPVSILVPTYARTRCLAEVLECFRRQDYPGSMELLILNDAREQHILSALPSVRMINMPERYPSLGDKRNACVELAAHNLFLFVDDDDVFMPWYVRTAMQGYLAWQKPTWPHAHLYASGRGDKLTMKHIPRTHPASYLMSKEQFAAIGRYPFVYAGGDQLLRSKAFAMFDCKPQKNAHIVPAGYVYRWNNDVYHISGSSDHPTAWVRTAADVNKRFSSGQEPQGVVRVEPAWEVDYLAIATKVMPA